MIRWCSVKYGEQWQFVNCTDRFQPVRGRDRQRQVTRRRSQGIAGRGQGQDDGPGRGTYVPDAAGRHPAYISGGGGNALVDFHKSEMQGTLRNGSEIFVPVGRHAGPAQRS